jgi:hypothetical protein
VSYYRRQHGVDDVPPSILSAFDEVHEETQGDHHGEP